MNKKKNIFEGACRVHVMWWYCWSQNFKYIIPSSPAGKYLSADKCSCMLSSWKTLVIHMYKQN